MAEAATRRSAAFVAIAAALMAAAWFSASFAGWRLAPDLGHCWAVPLLGGYLYWERWGERPALRPCARLPRFAWLALPVLGIAALPVRLLLTPYPLWPSALLVFLILAGGVTVTGAWLLAGRPGVRWTAGPLLLLVCCLPLPSLVESSVVLPIREAMARVVAELCNLLGYPALASGTSLRLGHGWIGIEEACSGIRSLQACVLFALFFGEWFRYGWRRRSGLVVLGILAAIGGNFARVLALALRSASGTPLTEQAHDVAGWTAMIASLLLTAGTAFAWNRFRLPQPRSAVPRAMVVSAVPRWTLAMALVFVANDAITRGWFAQARRADTPFPHWTARLPISHWSYHAEPLSTTAAEMLHPDIYQAGRWLAQDSIAAEAYYIEWTQGQAARSVPFLHNPTICLPYAGCELTASLPPIEVLWRGGTIPFYTYQFRRTDTPLLVAFTIWDPDRGQLLQRPEQTRTWLQWFRRHWHDVATGREHQPAQLLALSIAGSADARPQLQALLQTLVAPAP